MTDLEAQGGVDGEEFYVALNTSDYETTCGRGALRSNYFNYKEYRLAPPAAGSNIEASIWRLIIIGIESEYSKAEKDAWPYMLLVLFFFLLILTLAFTLPDDATLADHPARIGAILVLAAVVLLSMIVGLPCLARKKNKGYQKVVSTMAHRFQEQGFGIELVVHHDFCIITCPYVRFTPTGTGRQVEQNDDDLGVFNLSDWKPLEGKWEIMEKESEGKRWQFVLANTLEFKIIESRHSDQAQALQEDDEALNGQTGDSLTIDDTSFVSKSEIRMRVLWVNTHMSMTGKTTGNTHVMKSDNVNMRRGEVKITPLQTGGNTSCYRWGDSQVLIVQDSKMLLINFLYEELPPVSQLLSDALFLKEGRGWSEYTKIGFGGSGTGSTMAEIA
jgi:hypothetical protein